MAGTDGTEDIMVWEQPKSYWFNINEHWKTPQKIYKNMNEQLRKLLSVT